jgi:hypothetical protein
VPKLSGPRHDPSGITNVPQLNQRRFQIGATEDIWVVDEQTDLISRRAVEDDAVGHP